MSPHFLLCALSVFLGGAGGYLLHSVMAKMRPESEMIVLKSELKRLKDIVGALNEMIEESDQRRRANRVSQRGSTTPNPDTPARL